MPRKRKCLDPVEYVPEDIWRNIVQQICMFSTLKEAISLRRINHCCRDAIDSTVADVFAFASSEKFFKRLRVEQIPPIISVQALSNMYSRVYLHCVLNRENSDRLRIQLEIYMRQHNGKASMTRKILYHIFAYPSRISTGKPSIKNILKIK